MMAKNQNAVKPAITCSKLTYFTPCSTVAVVNFEQENAGWEAPVMSLNKMKPRFLKFHKLLRTFRENILLLIYLQYYLLYLYLFC